MKVFIATLKGVIDEEHVTKSNCGPSMLELISSFRESIVVKIWPAINGLWLSHHMWEAHISTNYNEGVSSSQEDFHNYTTDHFRETMKYMTIIKNELVSHQQPQPPPVNMIDCIALHYMAG